jgi:hypothetical protein
MLESFEYYWTGQGVFQKGFIISWQESVDFIDESIDQDAFCTWFCMSV